MDASSVVMRPNPCFSRGNAGIDAHSHRHSSLHCSSKKPPPSMMMMMMMMGFSSGSRRKQLDVGFYDKSHLDYYYYNNNNNNNNKISSSGKKISRCGGGKKEKKVKEEKQEKKMIKKRLKLLKGLSRDLSMFSHMTTTAAGFGFDSVHDLADQVKAKTISEAADLLLGQLQKLRAEEKELKRKRKEEKALLRAAQLHNRLQCDVLSSSSSSESSDSECDVEVVNMSRLKSGSIAQPIFSANQPVIEKETVNFSSISTPGGVMSLLQPLPPTVKSILPGSLAQEEDSTVGMDDQVCSSNSIVQEECCSATSKCCRDVGSASLDEEKSLVTGLSAKKIEVCMGGKCKKSGAALLLEEFQRLVGVDDVVVSGCKCMGKCKDGPNVRVVNNSIDVVAAGGMQDCVKTPANPLCIGVGLEDVGLIMTNFFGENQNEIGLATAP